MNDILEKLRINPLTEINEPPTYCSINNRPSLTAGNFSLINGKKKAGKTFLLGGIMASTINNSVQLDSIKGCLPAEKNAVLYFDTEQSQYHASRSIKRICTLTGNPNPSNLFSYGLRPLSPEERLKVIEAVISMTPNVGFVAIDGIRDLLTKGINDEQEATELTTKFLKWSYDRNIHIVLLLHQNKNDLNARGHIGSEVVNKAETIISVTKNEKSNIFKVVCEDSRDIPFDDFGFTINAEGLPVAIKLPETGQKKTADPQYINANEHIEFLRSIYENESKYNYNELLKNIMEEFNIGNTASRKFVKHYLDNQFLTRERDGKKVLYDINPEKHPFFSN